MARSTPSHPGVPDAHRQVQVRRNPEHAPGTAMATMGVIGRSRSWRMKAVVVTVGDVVTAAGRPRGRSVENIAAAMGSGSCSAGRCDAAGRRWDVSVYVVPLEEPESDATLTWKETTVIVAEPFGGGARGLGFSYATAACAPFIRDLLAPTVTGREILDVPGSWREMVEAIRNVGRPGVTSMAIAAVDIGLWDLKAKLLDLPLCRLLGMCHDRVAIYGSGGFTSLTAEQLTGQVDGWVNGEGIPRVKMKIGTDTGPRSTVIANASSWSARRSVTTPSCSSTPTARTPVNRRSGLRRVVPGDGCDVVRRARLVR